MNTEEKEDKLQKVVDAYPHVWKTKSALLSWIRGGIRRSLWNKSPQKLEFIKKNRIKIPNPNPNGRAKEVFGGVCYITGEALPLDKLQIDHKIGNHSLMSLDDLQAFIEGIALVTEQDLAFISLEAHANKTYAEKHGISYEEAKATREAIAICRNKQDTKWLEEKGISPAKNQAGRRTQIIDILREESEDALV